MSPAAKVIPDAVLGRSAYSNLATPFPGFGNRMNTSGSCPGMISRVLAAICFIRSCAARFDFASNVCAIGMCLSEILVQIDVVRRDHHAARLRIHAHILRRERVPSPGIDGHSRDDLLGVAVSTQHGALPPESSLWIRSEAVRSTCRGLCRFEYSVTRGSYGKPRPALINDNCSISI